VHGNVTSEITTGQPSVTRTYTGQQLMGEDFSGTQDKRYMYDALGNVDCVAKATYAGVVCPTAGSLDLLEDNVYDYQSRLHGYRYYGGSASASKTVDYTNDPLDRPLKQVETLSGQTTSIDFTYVGATAALSKEVLTGATNTTKRYAYDARGMRATITEGANRYSYLYDPHGSVSLLLDQSDGVRASYGYAAYGAANAALTKSAAGFDPRTNPYRYTGKRLDAGSGTYDMGARRYSADVGRFLQFDLYASALANFGLSTDPLTQNRYALAGANPINFVEVDGHVVLYDGDIGTSPWTHWPAAHYCEARWGKGCAEPEPERTSWGDVGEFLYEATGAKDVVGCSEGSMSSCPWAIAGLLPIGKAILSARMATGVTSAIVRGVAGGRPWVAVGGGRRDAARAFTRLVDSLLPNAQIEKVAPGVWVAKQGEQTIRLRAPARSSSVREGRQPEGTWTVDMDNFGLATQSSKNDNFKILFNPRGSK
jgi:RHS repeat-associated protein